jgi:hypothetical protein
VIDGLPNNRPGFAMGHRHSPILNHVLNHDGSSWHAFPGPVALRCVRSLGWTDRALAPAERGKLYSLMIGAETKSGMAGFLQEPQTEMVSEL